jgi:hypothetical protein
VNELELARRVVDQVRAELCPGILNSDDEIIAFLSWFALVAQKTGNLNLCSVNPETPNVIPKLIHRLRARSKIVAWAVSIWAVAFFFGNLLGTSIATSARTTALGGFFLFPFGILVYPLTVSHQRSAPFLVVKKRLSMDEFLDSWSTEGVQPDLLRRVLVTFACVCPTFGILGPLAEPYLKANSLFVWLSVSVFIVLIGGAQGGFAAGVLGCAYYGLSSQNWKSFLFAALCSVVGTLVFSCCGFAEVSVFPLKAQRLRSIFVKNLITNVRMELFQWGSFAVIVGAVMYFATKDTVWLRFTLAIFTLATISYGLFGGTAMAVSLFSINRALVRSGVLPKGVTLKRVLDRLVTSGVLVYGDKSGLVYEPYHVTVCQVDYEKLYG